MPLSQVSTLGHGLAVNMRLARSWKWMLVTLGGILYILSIDSDHISKEFLRKISRSLSSTQNNGSAQTQCPSAEDDPEQSGLASSLKNVTESKFLEEEMSEFLGENQERKELIK